MKILPVILVLLFPALVLGQENCPVIDVVGPSGIPGLGEPVVFKVQVEPALPGLAYKWTISSGKITDGQGTTVLKVLPDDPRYSGPVNLTATMEIVGLPKGISTGGSFVRVWQVPPGATVPGPEK